MDNLDEIYNFLKNSIEKADIQSKIDDIRVAYLGKKGKITELLKNLSSINNLEEKKRIREKNKRNKKFLRKSLKRKEKSYFGKGIFALSSKK